MKLFTNIGDVTPENDIKYRGPLSYRHLRIIGWLGMALVQISMVLLFALKAQLKWGTPVNEAAMTTWSNILENVGQLSVPLMLVANFALILNSKSNIKNIIRNNAILAAVFYVVFCLLYFRYAMGSIEHLFGRVPREVIDDLCQILFSRYMTFNCYIDMFIISVLYFFLTYRPKKYFTGKKTIYFRLFALLPIIYELSCHIIKGLALGQGLFWIPVAVLPLLTSKPVMTFVAFVFIIIFIKGREIYYVKKQGGTKDKYEQFLDTNLNSFQLSVYIAVTFAVCSIIDLACTAALMGTYFGTDLSSFGRELLWNSAYAYANAWGFGKALSLILGAPILLLFSYTRTYEDRTKAQDFIIPITGFSICVLIWFEGIYDTLMTLHIHQPSSSTSTLVESVATQARCIFYSITGK